MRSECKINMEKVAQLWCLPQHSNKTMDVEFAESVAELLKEKDEEIANLKKLNTGILNILDRKQSELDRANEKVKVLDELKSVKQPKENK